MSGLELAATLAIGGLAQAVLLVLVQSIHNKRSSLGVQLSGLREEMVKREDALRWWVKDSLAQMEADARQRDADTRGRVEELREEFRRTVEEKLSSDPYLNVIADRVGANVAARFAKAMATVKGNETMAAISNAIKADL